MSIAAMTSVWKDAPASGTELLLLLAIADMANDDFECWPSIKHLAKKVRVTERQVKRLLDKLILNELIEKKIGSGKGKYKGWETNLYILTPEKWPVTIELMSSDAQDTSDARVTPSHDTRVLTSHDTRDTLNHKSETKKETSSSELIVSYIKAWLDGQITQPVTNQYKNKTNRAIAEALANRAIELKNVTDYTRTLANEPYWQGKLVPFSKVGDNIAAWLQNKPAPTPVNPAHVPFIPETIDDAVEMPPEAREALENLKRKIWVSEEALYEYRKNPAA